MIIPLPLETHPQKGTPGRGSPRLSDGVFVAPTATIIGDVEVGRDASIWFNAVLRGDVMPIRIGDESNIQDGVIVHGTYNKCGVTVGRRVTVGHGAILHGCEISDLVLVGMGAIIMDQARIGSNSIVAAGALVAEGKQFPPGVLIVGRPALVKRELTADEREFLNKSANNYIRYKSWYKGI